MAGRIRDEDIALVRERTSIADVISEHVTLKSAGGGNLKGLCPFHDEKTPSFTVAPARNVYFCHGCGARRRRHQVRDGRRPPDVRRGGRAAGRPGRHPAALRSRPARRRSGQQQGQRQRLVAAHAAAAEFYAEQLAHAGRPAGPRVPRPARLRPGRRRAVRLRLRPRRLGPAHQAPAAEGLHRPRSWSPPGLAKPARSGSLIDRFRRRLLWPIRDLTGDVIGFGARKLFDDDDGPKYLNTPETPLYKKSHVLYGIDQAKREIAKQGRAVIVEGYTDVMACHLAGVPTAVATCGTAFGADHIGVLRRLLMDTDAYAGEIIFTFDGDAAGQKAALRAFEDDQRFVGADLHRGQPGQHGPVRAAAGQGRPGGPRPGRPPRAAGRLRAAARCCAATTSTRSRAGSSAMRAAAPLVGQAQGPGEARPSTPASSPATSAWRSSRCSGRWRPPATARTGAAPAQRRPPGQRSTARRRLVEREALKLALQEPVLAGPMFDALGAEAYAPPGPRRRPRGDRRGRRRRRRPPAARSGSRRSATPAPTWPRKALVGELAVEPLRVDGEPDPRYVDVTLARLQLGRGQPAGSGSSSRRCSGSTR